MPRIFDIETKNVKKLVKFAKRSPILFGRAYAMTQNNLAFEIKKHIPKALDEKYNIRSPGFVSSSIRVDKARARTNLSQIEATVGSIRRPRFSGWIEPQTGKAPDEPNKPTMDSRRGNVANKIVNRYRFKSSNKFVKPSQYKGKSKQQRNIVMLKTLARQNYRQPFLIQGNRRVKPGLYAFGAGNRLRMIQSTKPNRKPVKRYDWVDRSLRITAIHFSLQKAWEVNINRVLPRKL